MGIYARQPARLAGQVVTDAFVLAWTVGWALLGRFVHGAALKVATPAREAAAAADQVSQQFRTAAEQAARVPGLGDSLRRPFDAASGGLGGVIAAADAQVASIERLATLLGWLVFAVPVAVLLAGWLPRRIRFVLRARAAQRYIDSSADLDLFALRAMASQPMHVLARISPDPVGAWRAGDATVIHKLAETELRRSGLRLPTATSAAASDGDPTSGRAVGTDEGAVRRG
jgi:hypothetical protein